MLEEAGKERLEEGVEDDLGATNNLNQQFESICRSKLEERTQSEEGPSTRRARI